MVKFSKVEQLRMLDALPPRVKNKIAKMARVEAQKGQGGAGLKSILSKAKSLLGPIASVIGPIALKEFVIKPGIKSLLGSGKKPATKRKKKPQPVNLLAQ
jgi:hypothetical protein